jgi:hypothetical protein
VNKFTRLIAGGNEATLLARATQVARSAELAQKALINGLETQVQELSNALHAKLDLAPETTDSLRPAGNGFKAHQWVEDVQQLKVALKKANEQLDIAMGTYAVFFEVEPTPARAG